MSNYTSLSPELLQQYPNIPYNFTDCTLKTCPLELANLDYDPSLGGNLVFLIIFSVLLVVQLGLGIAYRTWGFMVATAMGLVLEVIGYVARVQMHYNPFTANPFLMYIICLTIAPVFLSAAIYICLARIIVIYGEDIARFTTKAYTVTFMCCDFFSLILQAAGGAITDTADSGSPFQQTGINIMIAGLAFQVVSLFVFICLASDYFLSVLRHHASTTAILPCSRSLWLAFITSLALATMTIFIRSCFRVAELKGGFDSGLANNQSLFIGLESTMVTIACIALTVFHPGPVLKSSGWKIGKAKDRRAMRRLGGQMTEGKDGSGFSSA
ncbi:hypothetical protein MMC09_003030 [Bachmanniomyces sp. S44760]|nr:hypothetical protein [Bachmanniomyces sp. S44760]